MWHITGLLVKKLNTMSSEVLSKVCNIDANHCRKQVVPMHHYFDFPQ